MSAVWERIQGCWVVTPWRFASGDRRFDGS